LSIPQNAGENEIKKAYKKLALKWHPDKNCETEETRLNAEQTFKDISEAYSVLSDPKKKERYDSGADLEEIGSGEMNVNVNEIFQQFFGGRSPFGSGGGGGGTTFRTSFRGF